jgi:hypothetical protein
MSEQLSKAAYIIGVDPGSCHVGWAGYTHSPLVGAPKLVYGVIHRRSTEKLPEFGERCGQFLSDSFPCETLVIEKPSFRCNLRSWVAGNALLDTSIVLGFIAAHLEYRKILLPTPEEWKGNLNSSMVAHRLMEGYRIGAKSHAADAVGLMFFGMGVRL